MVGPNGTVVATPHRQPRHAPPPSGGPVKAEPRDTAGTARTEKMRAGRQADSARRRQRVIAAINQAGAVGTEISISAIARAAIGRRPHVPLPAPRPARAGPRARSSPARRDSRRALRHPRVPAGRPARRPRTRRPAQRPRPAARETTVRGTRRAGLARIRPRRATRHRHAHRQDHPGRTAIRRPAHTTRRPRRRTRRRTRGQPRAHDPHQPRAQNR